MNIDKAIKERHSARRFSTKKVKWQDIIEAIDAANLAPLAGNIYSRKFILVDDKDKIKELAEASQQSFFQNVDYVVAICSDKTSVVKSYDKRGETYSRQQAGAAVENFLLKIVDLGLSSCWIGAFVDDEVKRVLEIPQQDYENIDVEALLPVAYEMPKKAEQKRKANLDNVLWFNKWKNKYMREPRKPEAI
ncbi:MAG: nitroreductase family protein [Nanoarchaeota archaeon]